jgi:transposase-like protein
VEHLAGSDLAKERVKAVLQTVAGSARLQEACERLDICEQRFHQLRQQILEGALSAAEPGVPGRRAQVASPAEHEVERLQKQVAELQRELEAAKVREEIALVLAGRKAPESLEKKALPPRRGRPPGTRKNT